MTKSTTSTKVINRKASKKASLETVNKLVAENIKANETDVKKAVETKTSDVSIFSKTATNDAIKSNVVKALSQKSEKTNRNTDNVRLSSFKTKNDSVNSTFIIETACCIASRTLKRVTIQQITLFIESVMQFKTFHYQRETSNVTRVRNHIKATTKKRLYDYDADNQTIVFTDSFIEENRKNKSHAVQVDSDLKYIQNEAVKMNHVLIK